MFFVITRHIVVARSGFAYVQNMKMSDHGKLFLFYVRKDNNKQEENICISVERKDW